MLMLLGSIILYAFITWMGWWVPMGNGLWSFFSFVDDINKYLSTTFDFSIGWLVIPEIAILVVAPAFIIYWIDLADIWCQHNYDKFKNDKMLLIWWPVLFVKAFFMPIAIALILIGIGGWASTARDWWQK